MKLGLHIPLEFFSPVEAITVIQAADKAGLDLAVVNDHLMLPWTPRVGEAWTTLAAIATTTKQIRLGPCVSPLPLRHPFMVAKQSVVIDQLSHGRFIMGVGSGWFRNEFDSIAVPYFGLKNRHAQTEEALSLLRELWTRSSVTFQGQYYQTENLILEPKPVSQPHPPFYFGGGSKTILALTAKYGMGWMPFAPPLKGLQRRVKQLDALLQSEGRLLSEIQIVPSVIFQLGRNQEQAFKQLPNYLRSIQDSRFRYILGTPNDCVEQIREYTKVGATHLVLRLVNPLQAAKHVKSIATKILPQL